MLFHFGYTLLAAVFFLVVSNVLGVDETIRTTTTQPRCNGSSRKNTCTFDSAKLQNLDTTSSPSIDFIVNNGNRVICRKERGSEEDYLWYGSSCDGDASDANFIRRSDTEGNVQVFGSVRVGSDVCQISPNAQGISEMTCTAMADFPPEKDAIEPPPEDEDDFTDRASQNFHFGFNPRLVENKTDKVSQSLRGNPRRTLYDNSGATIDVMVVWTKQAECQWSKLSSTCTISRTTENNMRGLIDLAVAEANIAFNLSGILSSLRLVHAYRDPLYVEPTNNTFDTSLIELQTTSDGKLDDVHAKRALYGADIVQMLIGM